MSETETEQAPWTAEEQALIDATQAYNQAIAACVQAGGRTQAAMLAAIPEELRASMPMLGALGL